MNTTEQKPAEKIFTCQICGRPIKAKKGTIAHHGYKRPHRYSGWQTASCRGAQQRPYEVSCDYIHHVVEWLEEWVVKQEAFLADFAKNPPEIIVAEVYNGAWNPRKKVERHRSEGFDPSSEVFKGRRSNGNTYEHEYFDLKYRTEQAIEEAQKSLTYMRERIANWKAPEEATNAS